MTRYLLIAALTLGSVSLQAQTPTFNLTLTSANGGANTLFSWSYTGEISETYTDSSFGIYEFILIRGSESIYTTATNPGVNAFVGSPSPFYALGDTDLVMTNSHANGTSTQLLNIKGYGPSFFRFTKADPSTPFWIYNGENIITLSGPTSGSSLSEIDFSNFNAGQWTTLAADANVQAGLFPGLAVVNFDTVLTIVGTPIPEPSTYGLILGGLALAGAAIRRRKSAK